MSSPLQRALRRTVAVVDHRLNRWRAGTEEGQTAMLGALVALTLWILVGSLLEYQVVPAVWFVVPMLLGAMALRYKLLWFLILNIGFCVALTVTVESITNGMTAGRISTLIGITVLAAIVLFDGSRHRSGLPSLLGEAMLVDLRNRLQAAGTVPPLPEGWASESAMRSAGGAKFAGDFLVADLSKDESTLEMVLVDVCGKGVAAGTQSLQLAGALGGLIGALPPVGLFTAANDFLLRQRWDDGFATAVHVLIDLRTGSYSIINAGHPPALSWDGTTQEWAIDGARGLALGIADRPDFHLSTGVLEPGDALMFYTDGVVESYSRDVMVGIEWLRGIGRDAVSSGFTGAPKRIISKVPRQGSEDDRAVLMLSRSAVTVTSAPDATSAVTPTA